MLVKNVSLTANEHLQKSIRFKDMINDADLDIFQGVMKGSECNKCNSVNIRALNTISCGKCNQVYHTTCLNEPLEATVCSSIKYNPNLWWLCLHCLTAKTKEVSLQKCDVDLMITEKLSVAMDGLKNDILSSINDCLINRPSFDSTPSVDKGKHVEKQVRASDNQGTKRKAGDEPGALPKVPRTADSPYDKSANDVFPTSTLTYASSVQSNTALNSNEFRRNNQRQRRIKSVNPVESAPKFLLHFRPLIDKNNMILKTDEWYQLRRTISEKLNNIKVSFSHFNPKTGKVVIGFPNQKSKSSASIILKDISELWCFESYTPAKMLPKLTIHNVPLDFDLPENNSTENADVYTQRDLVKGKIWQTIIDKNEGVRSLVENGSTLEIVYFKQRNYTATVAVKVSPDIRLHILDKCDSKLYIFSGRCKISDRCHYQQCFHCLKFGHILKDCPRATHPPVCKFCTEAHDGKSCPKKDLPNEYKCANCKHSKSPHISKAFNTHSAASRDCPSVLSIVDRIQRNTLFTITQTTSKNG